MAEIVCMHCWKTQREVEDLRHEAGALREVISAIVQAYGPVEVSDELLNSAIPWQSSYDGNRKVYRIHLQAPAGVGA